MYGFIYETTNDINGMKYIGQKKYDKRGNWKTYLGSGIYLNRAIQKYGEEHFKKRIIEECSSKKELNEREIYWINYYNSVNSDEFYNISNGGDGGNTIAGYTEEQLLEYKRRKSIIHSASVLKGENSPTSKLTESKVIGIIEMLKDSSKSSLDIAKYYNVRSSTIDDIFHHRTWKDLSKNIKFPDRKCHIQGGKNKKEVYQYDLDGNYIAKYDSCHDAERATGIGFKMISRVCNGNRDFTHGYIFKYT